MKNILNLKSEIYTSRKSEFKAIFHDVKRNYELDNPEVDFFTYLFTLLIELDPL